MSLNTEFKGNPKTANSKADKVNAIKKTAIQGWTILNILISEFRQNLLQGLREPIESRNVTVVRAEKNIQYPADFQLVMTANPCPCGNLGRDERVCWYSAREVQYNWKRLGNALLDRIDIRVPVKPVSVEQMTGGKGNIVNM